MNDAMFAAAPTQRNLGVLRERGIATSAPRRARWPRALRSGRGA